jgi:hypothetical protein
MGMVVAVVVGLGVLGVGGLLLLGLGGGAAYVLLSADPPADVDQVLVDLPEVAEAVDDGLADADLSDGVGVAEEVVEGENDEADNGAEAAVPAPKPSPRPAARPAPAPAPVAPPVEPDPVDAVVEEPIIPPIDETLGSDMVTVRISTSPPGAAILMDGNDVGASPVTTQVEAGSHRVRIDSDKAFGSFSIEAGGAQTGWCYQVKGTKIKAIDC